LEPNPLRLLLLEDCELLAQHETLGLKGRP
jgi:hypothetical protein